MARPVTLFTGQWADLPLADLAAKLETWGFDGVELACWGDHFEVDRAVADPGYVAAMRQLLEQHGLGCWAIGAHLVGQAVCDPIDARHKGIQGLYEQERLERTELWKDVSRLRGLIPESAQLYLAASRKRSILGEAGEDE